MTAAVVPVSVPQAPAPQAQAPPAEGTPPAFSEHLKERVQETRREDRGTDHPEAEPENRDGKKAVPDSLSDSLEEAGQPEEPPPQAQERALASGVELLMALLGDSGEPSPGKAPEGGAMPEAAVPRLAGRSGHPALALQGTAPAHPPKTPQPREARAQVPGTAPLRVQSDVPAAVPRKPAPASVDPAPSLRGNPEAVRSQVLSGPLHSLKALPAEAVKAEPAGMHGGPGVSTHSPPSVPPIPGEGGASGEARGPLALQTPLRYAALHRQGDPPLVEQLAVRISTATREGSHEVRMTLRPESLGHLRILLASEERGLRATIVADNPQAKAAIESSLPQLREILAHHGLRMEQLSVSVGQERFPSRHDPGDAGAGGGPRRGREALTQPGPAADEPARQRPSAGVGPASTVDLFV